MKTIETVHIASIAFHIDTDALAALREYLSAIEQQLTTDQQETLTEVECRIAELLTEWVPSAMRVVTIEHIDRLRQQLGQPADFAPEADPEQEAAPKRPSRRLYRPRANRSIAGVCAGLANYFHTDPTLIRLIALLSTLFAGFTVLIYLILWIAIPSEEVKIIQPCRHD